MPDRAGRRGLPPGGLLALVLSFVEESQGVIVELLDPVKILDHGIKGVPQGRLFRPELLELRPQPVDLKVSGEPGQARA